MVSEISEASLHNIFQNYFFEPPTNGDEMVNAIVQMKVNGKYLDKKWTRGIFPAERTFLAAR